MIRVVLTGSDNILSVDGVFDIINNNFLNFATVSVTIFDSDNAEVVGIVWPVVLDYIPNSEGDYIGVLSDDAVFAIGQVYRANVIIDAGVGLRLVENHELVIMDRQR